MHPILFQIGPFTIYSYGTLVALAFIVTVTLITKQAHLFNIPKEKIVDFSFWLILSGIIGARLLYVILNLSFFIDNPKEIFMIHHGGLVWYGAVFGAVIGGMFYLKKNKIAIPKMVDLIAPYIALGQAIGRLGCFLNGCCYGRPASWGIYFPVHNERLIPTQLFSSFILIVIFIILRILQSKSHKDGQIFVYYLMLHSSQRFFIEFLRADSPSIFLNLTIFQIISIIIFALSLYANLYLKGSSKR